MREVINTMKALSDEIRLRIINILYEEDLYVCEIVEVLSLPQSTVSRHLTILKNSNIIEDTKHGQWAYYKLIKGKDDDCFIKCLINNVLKENPIFLKDIEILNKRLKKSRGCETK